MRKFQSFLVLFIIVNCVFQSCSGLHTESLILLISFFFVFLFVLFNVNENDDKNVKYEDIDYTKNVDCLVLSDFFLKFRNWYRHLVRYIYIKLNKFYKFLKRVKEFFIVWIRDIVFWKKKNFFIFKKGLVNNRLRSLERLKNFSQHKSNPLDYIVI